MRGEISWAIVIPLSLFFLYLLVKVLQNIKGYEVIIERFGSYHKTLSHGVHFLIPFFEKKKQVRWNREEEVRLSGNRSTYKMTRYNLCFLPINEQEFDFPEYKVITKDMLRITINGMLFYRIIDTKKAVYNITDLYQSFHKLTETGLRNCVSKMDLMEVISRKNEIEQIMLKDLDFVKKNWGIQITKLDIQDVNPPDSFLKNNELIWKEKRDLEVKIERQKTERERQLMEQKTKSEIQEMEYARKINKEKSEREIRKIKADSDYYDRQKNILYVKELLESGIDQKYLECLEYCKSWREICKLSPDKTFIIPYESAQFFGVGNTNKTFLKNKIE